MTKTTFPYPVVYFLAFMNRKMRRSDSFMEQVPLHIHHRYWHLLNFFIYYLFFTIICSTCSIELTGHKKQLWLSLVSYVELHGFIINIYSKLFDRSCVGKYKIFSLKDRIPPFPLIFGQN
jgi:hypothetical protein